jgi:hypothetical protein
MSEGLQMVLWIAGVHFIGFLCIAVMLLPAMRDDGGQDSRSDESDGGWGRGPKTPPRKPIGPRGGIPLPDAVQSARRLRGQGRLSDRSRERRPAREPRTPRRAPAHAPHRLPARTPHRVR